jgi:hypothetical protein
MTQKTSDLAIERSNDAKTSFERGIVLLGPCFVAPKVLREEAASAEIVPRKWPKVPFYRASALQTDIKIE